MLLFVHPLDAELEEGSGGLDLVGTTIRILDEIFLEHAGKLLARLVEGIGVLPTRLGVQQFAGNALDLLGVLKAEEVDLTVLRINQLFVVDGINQGPRVLQGAPLADAVTASHPAGVQQIGVCIVFFQFIGEHLSIDDRMPDQERGTET